MSKSKIIQEIETLTGEIYSTMTIDHFESFLKTNHHLKKEISYTLGFILGTLETVPIIMDRKLFAFINLLYTKFNSKLNTRKQ